MVLSGLQYKPRDLFPALVDHFHGHELGVETDQNGKLSKTVASFYIKMRQLSKTVASFYIKLRQQNYFRQSPIKNLKNAGTIKLLT